MLNYKEIKGIEQLKKIIDADEMHCGTPLFHGTRRYALQTTDADRERFSAACRQVIAFANKFYYSGKVDFEKLNTYQRESGNYYFLSTVVHQYDSSLFQYGDFYLTSSYENAIGFAHQRGGESGDWARAQVKGFEDWGVELDGQTKAAAETVKREYEKYKDSEKVILVYYGVSFGDLCSERGEPLLDKADGNRVLSEFARIVIEDLSDMENEFALSYNFRLSNVQNYTACVLPERMFRDGVVLFENESDVDKFIRRHNSICIEKWSF